MVVLPRVNELLLRLKHAAVGKYGTEILRSVGALDLIVASLQFRGKGVFARGNATFFGGMRFSGEDVGIEHEDLSTPVPHEWASLIRATDLVNHGYYREGFVSAFALLDASVQDFIASLLQERRLSNDQARDLAIGGVRASEAVSRAVPPPGRESVPFQ